MGPGLYRRVDDVAIRDRAFWVRFVPLREGGEFTLYRGCGNPSPILVVASAAEHPSPQSLRRLEHEYSLAAEVDPLWPAKPHRAGHLVRVLSRQYSAIKILAKVIDDSALKPRIFRRENMSRAKPSS